MHQIGLAVKYYFNEIIHELFKIGFMFNIFAILKRRSAWERGPSVYCLTCVNLPALYTILIDKYSGQKL